MEDRSREMKFDVMIIETLSKVFTVSAMSQSEAIDMVRKAYLEAEDIDGNSTVLDADCFDDVEFEAKEIEE